MVNEIQHTRSSEIAQESERIRKVYSDRKETRKGPLDLYGLCTLQERLELLVRFFRQAGLISLTQKKILDVGCGSGGALRRFVDFGAEPENCFGIDARSESLVLARQFNPGITFLEANAARLPFGDREFDFVMQSTVFTSILDDNIKREVASEITRTLRPGGHLIWYDFVYSNPRNPQVRGVGRKEIESLFPGYRYHFQRLTLAPPIGRVVVRFSPALYRSLALFPMLRTHCLCFAQKL
jgi:ubiquinone/menaquinone biosynthesis C-methylase UbiE